MNFPLGKAAKNLLASRNILSCRPVVRVKDAFALAVETMRQVLFTAKVLFNKDIAGRKSRILRNKRVLDSIVLVVHVNFSCLAPTTSSCSCTGFIISVDGRKLDFRQSARTPREEDDELIRAASANEVRPLGATVAVAVETETRLLSSSVIELRRPMDDLRSIAVDKRRRISSASLRVEEFLTTPTLCCCHFRGRFLALVRGSSASSASNSGSAKFNELSRVSKLAIVSRCTWWRRGQGR